MLKLPSAFTNIPEVLRCCNARSTVAEIETANRMRKEYLLPDQSSPYMEDVVRAFRVAQGAKVYIEVGTQDRGNIAWLARTKLARGATIIDIDSMEYADNERKLRNELEASEFDYHSIRGDCLSDEVLAKVRAILNGRAADVIFCDSHYTYAHTLTEFTLYQPLCRKGGVLLFHDAQWPGNPTRDGEEGQKGKGLAIEQLDRFYPAWMVVGPDTPLHRALPIVSREGHWGTLAMFPC
jgi:predicted O-methyltransferase YrrM